MDFPEFCRGSAKGRATVSGNERLVNMYLEPAAEKGQFALLPRFGKATFATVGTGPHRGEIQAENGKVYSVSGGSLYEVNSAGVATLIGIVGTASGNPPVAMAASETQLLVISAGSGYVYNFSTLVFGIIADSDFPNGDAVDCDYTDGYFLVLANNIVQFSANGDATNWDALDFFTVASSANNLIAISVDHRQVIVYGDLITQVFNNTGSANVFDADPSGIIQQGLAARDSHYRLDNTSFFLGKNENGQGVVYRFNGYTPQRVSNHQVESAIQTYDNIDDAVAYAWQCQGHPFYVISFPTAVTLPNGSVVGRTWCYDASLPPETGWFEITFVMNGLEQEDLGRFYVFAFGKHLVGSRNSNILYEMSGSYYSDNGTAIQFLRQCRLPNNEKKRMYYSRIELDMQPGVGLQVGSSVAGYNPMALLRFSHDGGNTFGGYRQCAMGKIGEYSARVFWTRFRNARDPVIEFSCTDPVFTSIVNCFLTMQAGTN